MSVVNLPRNSAEQISQDYLSRIKRIGDSGIDNLFHGRTNYLRVMEMSSYHDHTVMRIKTMLPKINLISGDYNRFISSIANRLIDISIYNDEYIKDNDIQNTIKEELNKRTDSLFYKLFRHVESCHPKLLYERLILEIKTNLHSSEISNYINYLNTPMDDKLRRILNRLLELPIFDQYVFTLESVWDTDSNSSPVALYLRELLFIFIRMGLEDISSNKIYKEYYRVIHEDIKETLDKMSKNHSYDPKSVEYLLFNFLSGKIRNYNLNNYNHVGKEGMIYVKMLKYVLTDDGESDFKMRVTEGINIMLNDGLYKCYPRDMEELYQFFEAFPDQFNIFSNNFLKYILDK